MSSKSKSLISIDFGGLTLILIILKLTHVINWSWWWVFAPVWLPILLVVGFFIIIAIIAVIAEWLK